MSVVSSYFANPLTGDYKNILYGNDGYLYLNKGVSIYKIDVYGNETVFATLSSVPLLMSFDNVGFPSGYLYVTITDTVKRIDSSGTVTDFKTSIITDGGLVLDSSNNVYVGDNANAIVRKIDQNTLEVTSFITGADDVSDIQIDNSGNFYTVGNGNFNYNLDIHKYNSSGDSNSKSTFLTISTPFSCFRIIFDSSNNAYAIIDNGSSSTIKKYNSSGTSLNSSIYSTGSFGIRSLSFDTSGNLFFQNIRNSGNYSDVLLYGAPYTPPSPPFVCFKEGSKILTDTGYKPIQELRKDDLVKTLCDGFKAVDMIGFREIEHVASSERIKDQLYRCSNDSYSEVFEDLVITGCHSILVDEFASEEQR